MYSSGNRLLPDQCVLTRNLQDKWRFESLQCKEFIWFPPFAFFCIFPCCLSHMACFSMNLLWSSFYRQKECLGGCPSFLMLLQWFMHINVTNSLLQNGLWSLKKIVRELWKIVFQMWTPPHTYLKDTGDTTEGYGDFPAFCLIAVLSQS